MMTDQLQLLSGLANNAALILSLTILYQLLMTRFVPGNISTCRVRSAVRDDHRHRYVAAGASDAGHHI